MTDLLAGLLIAMAVGGAPSSVTNAPATDLQSRVPARTGLTNATAASRGIPSQAVNDPTEKEYQQVMEQDDATQDQIQKWSQEAEDASRAGDPQPKLTLRARVSQQLKVVKKAYEAFLEKHPNHARARLAFGSFLNDTGEEEGAVEQWDKARVLDPSNPAAWNNLANYYGHRSPVKKAFEYYEKAIQLDPNESVYYWNFATTVYLFRPDAREYYSLAEQHVFDKALDLYRKALKLDPTNFVLATDYSESFYGTNPPRWQAGLEAWKDTLKLAHDEVEREGVYIHLARINIKLGLFDDARTKLNLVTNANYAILRHRLDLNLAQAMKGPATNATPASAH